MTLTNIQPLKALSSGFMEVFNFLQLRVGMNYNVVPHIRVSAGYQYIDSIGKANIGKYDGHGFLVGVTHTFSNTAQPELAEPFSASAVEEILVLTEDTATDKPSPQTQ